MTKNQASWDARPDITPIRTRSTLLYGVTSKGTVLYHCFRSMSDFGMKFLTDTDNGTLDKP